MTVAAASARFNRSEWSSAFRNVETELTDVLVNPARGTVPNELRGTLYRNGPGRLERDGQRVHHPFDGDGMITALHFDENGVHCSNRFVRTSGWMAEEKAGKVLFRGVFGSQKPGGPLANAFDLRLKNIANTGVIKLGDDLLALWEAAEPYALDPQTLQTRGLSLLGGVLKKGEAFSAHPRFDPGHHGDPRMVTFGVNTGPRSTVRLMEFATTDDPSAGVKAGDLLSDRRDTFSGFAFLHDFAITPNWAVFLQNAINFNPLPFVLGQKGAAQCLTSNPKGKAKFWLIPRDCGAFAGQEPRILDAPDGFVFHHLNAWEEEGDVVVESIYYSDFPSIGPDQDFADVNFDLIPEGLLEQCRINLASGSVRTTRLSERCCEFAMVNPHQEGLSCRFAWMAAAAREQGNDPLQVVKKLDLKTGERTIWSAAPSGFVSEPLMVPRPGGLAEDDGWVLDLVWNGERDASDLVILDASNLNEIAVLELPLAIPHGLHGSWVEDH